MKIVAAACKAVGGKTPRGFRFSRAHTLVEVLGVNRRSVHQYTSTSLIGGGGGGGLRIEAVL